MTQVEFTATDADIEAMVRIIVDTAQPDRVILFGSHANGNTNANSDVDFLIVEEEEFGPDRKRAEEFMRIREALSDFLVPMDLLIYSRAEFDRWKESSGHVIGRAVDEGRLLYERS